MRLASSFILTSFNIVIYDPDFMVSELLLLPAAGDPPCR
jgi:hypothetical protein